ncbi:MAG: WYL domain-containing transcriptional regulator [Actinobacteria bacterium]|nr:WYL domain-containing transcriptional regulator [Actinomycetota bacterium]
MSARLERLINLTATLLETRRPLTLDELADRLEPGYPDELASRRRQFERDKETLRELGVPITVEAVDSFGGDQGYRIRPEDYYLPDPGLDPAERAALHLAVTAVEVGGFDPLDALRKLGGAEGEGAGQAVAAFELTPHLGDCFDAVTRRSLLGFRYRGEVRRLEPYGILHRFGHWYVVGRDVDRDGPRAFRVDRFDGPPDLGPRGAFTVPPDVDPTDYLSSDPLTYGDDQPIPARVLIDATRASLVVGALGPDAVVEQRDDGAVVVALDVVNRDAFRAFVLDLLDHAEVLAPPELRADVVAWLTALAEAES